MSKMKILNNFVHELPLLLTNYPRTYYHASSLRLDLGALPLGYVLGEGCTRLQHWTLRRQYTENNGAVVVPKTVGFTTNSA